MLQSNGHYELFNRNVRVTQTRGTAENAELPRAAVADRVSADLREIDLANEPIEVKNVPVPHLSTSHRKALGDHSLAWTSWWSEQLGYRYRTTQSSPKPLVTQEIATPYVPPPPKVVVTQTPLQCIVASPREPPS